MCLKRIVESAKQYGTHAATTTPHFGLIFILWRIYIRLVRVYWATQQKSRRILIGAAALSTDLSRAITNWLGLADDFVEAEIHRDFAGSGGGAV